jgi:hypothetical protein
MYFAIQGASHFRQGKDPILDLQVVQTANLTQFDRPSLMVTITRNSLSLWSIQVT